MCRSQLKFFKDAVVAAIVWYSTWIDIYHSNRWLSSLTKFIVWFSTSVFETTFCDKVCQWLVGSFLWILRCPPIIKMTAAILLKYYRKWRYSHVQQPKPINGEGHCLYTGYHMIETLTTVHYNNFFSYRNRALQIKKVYYQKRCIGRHTRQILQRAFVFARDRMIVKCVGSSSPHGTVYSIQF